MTDPIIDDVEALLENGYGDKQILEQIERAAKNNEVISNFERNYVKKLTQKHFGQPPVETETPQIPKPTPAPPTPDVEIPTTFASKVSESGQILAPQKKVTKSSSKNTIIMIGGGIAALAIIIAVALSMGGDSTSVTTPVDINPTTSTSNTFSVKVDSSSYNRGDIISINGQSQLSQGNQVRVTIENSDNIMIWSEQVSAKSDGRFNTMTFAGGDGWSQAGKFTIKAEANGETSTQIFTFTG